MSRPARIARKNRHQRKTDRRPALEPLENRYLLTAAPGSTDPLNLLSSGLCNCPICTGQGLPTDSTSDTSTTPSASSGSLSSLPALSSNPGARAKLVLDFDGDFQATWGAWSNATTPVFDRDGDATTFSDTELLAIQEIWARVAEDYAPFNIDVTTIDPGVLTERVVAHIAIGGNGSWYGSSAGGVAYVGGFYNSAPNVGYVFEDNLSSAKSIADAASHEAGHLFGLSHQSLWSDTTLVSSYNRGNADWAPIMGTGYYSARTTWHNGATNVSSTAYQDDISILAGANNGFGLKADDFGSSISTASSLSLTGGSVNLAGLLGRHDDVDVWQFSTLGGSASFALSVIAVGSNLDATLELRDAGGNLLAIANPGDSWSAGLSMSLTGGTYFLIARSDGSYGNMGQYTLAGSIENATQSPPELSLLVDGQALTSGSLTDVGRIPLGSVVSKTFTVTNTGSGTLTLSLIDPAALPPGFTLVSNFGSTTLDAGQSTQFVIQFSGSELGEYGGLLQLLSNDADEGTFDLSLRGSVEASAIVVDDGSSGWTRSGPWKQVKGQGYGNNYYTLNKANSSQYASWSFSGLAAGEYRVWATWVGASGNTASARYSALEGGSSLASWTVSQRTSASGLAAEGVAWSSLGSVTLSGNQLVIRLANGGSGTLVADAIRVEWIGSGGAAAGSLASAPSDRAALLFDAVHTCASQTHSAATGTKTDAAQLPTTLDEQAMSATSIMERADSFAAEWFGDAEDEEQSELAEFWQSSGADVVEVLLLA